MTDKPHKNLAAALAAAQSQMGKALKDSQNPHFKSTYADLSSVMSACMPALNANGIAVVQPFFDDENGRYVKTILIHGDSGETMECRVPLIVNKNDMQGFGSAATYARRYGLMAMAGIAPEDDDGNAAAKNPPSDGQRPAQPTQEQLDMAKDAMQAAETVDQLRAIYADMPAPIRAALKGYATKLSEDLKTVEAAAPDDDLGGDEIPNFGGNDNG